ncbi:MAG: helix-turn-helix domain-containing protein, partial [Candidatus Sericytochromatia bacterium]|nr:helix-turn-helix domain-containing protein [Candidatus Tanganyikabacteria bacterium]
MPMEKLLTPAEVAERLRVSATTLSIWRCTGRQKLPYVKRGRSVLYRESDVAA